MPYRCGSFRVAASQQPKLNMTNSLDDPQAALLEEKAARKAARKAERADQVVEHDDDPETRMLQEKAARKAARRAECDSKVAHGEGHADDTLAAEKAARTAAKKAEREQLVAECEDDADAKLAEEKAARRAARKALSEQHVPECQEDANAKLADEKAARKAARKAQRETQVEELEGDQDAAQTARSVSAAGEQGETSKTTVTSGNMEEDAAWKAALNGDLGEVSGNAKERRKAARALLFQAQKRKAFEMESAENTPAAKEAKQKQLLAAGASGAEAFRQVHQIVVSGDCPDPYETFDSSAPHLGSSLSKALRGQGYSAPTPIQAQAWPIALTGRDMIGVAKTGSGKTCGFLLPALVRIKERGPAPKPKVISYTQSEAARPSVLVLAPTRELAQQIAGEAEKFAATAQARVVTLYGGVPKGPQVGELRKGVDILIATPGRLIDLLGGDPKKGILPSVSLEAVTYLVLDEADRMIDQGFEPDIRNIVGQCPKAGSPEEGGGAAGPHGGTQRQTLFFTATWPQAVESTASSLTSETAVHIRIGQVGDGDGLTANSMVTQEVCVCESDEKLSKLKKHFSSSLGPGDTVIVFSQTRSGCDQVEAELKGAFPDIWIAAIHKDKDQRQREETLGEFRRLTAEGLQGILVATDVASRGLDIPGVALVVVYDFGRGHAGANTGVESYVHRIGRTGRAGKTGHALTYFTSDDSGAKELVEMLENSNQIVPSELRQIAEQEHVKKRRKVGGTAKW